MKAYTLISPRDKTPGVVETEFVDVVSIDVVVLYYDTLDSKLV